MIAALELNLKKRAISTCYFQRTACGLQSCTPEWDTSHTCPVPARSTPSSSRCTPNRSGDHRGARGGMRRGRRAHAFHIFHSLLSSFSSPLSCFSLPPCSYFSLSPRESVVSCYYFRCWIKISWPVGNVLYCFWAALLWYLQRGELVTVELYYLFQHHLVCSNKKVEVIWMIRCSFKDVTL